MLGVFVTDVKRLTGNLVAMAASEDVTAFQRVAHGLAGAAGAVGARQLEQACRAAMTRPGLAVADLKPTATAIGGMADTALAELALFVRNLDADPSRR